MSSELTTINKLCDAKFFKELSFKSKKEAMQYAEQNVEIITFLSKVENEIKAFIKQKQTEISEFIMEKLTENVKSDVIVEEAEIKSESSKASVKKPRRKIVKKSEDTVSEADEAKSESSTKKPRRKTVKKSEEVKVDSE